MPNITMVIDDHLLRKARKVALEKGTTLSGLIRRFLKSIVTKEEMKKGASLARLTKIWESSGVVVGRIHWNREDLHGR
ncbi:MAG: hypothetical protein IPN19_13930 [Elusimicrobia bacterium]|nr:hypothetical protein [Elusimicrobiota bacterium]